MSDMRQADIPKAIDGYTLCALLHILSERGRKAEKKTLMKKLKYYIISLLIVFLDQLSKIYIRSNMELGESWRLTPKFLWFTYVENTGAAFSFSLGAPLFNRILFSTISLLASAGLVYMLYNSDKVWEKLSYCLILGGAVGNLIDRLLLGRVTDFINCDFPDILMERWPIFNVADSSVVVGVVLLGIYLLFFERREIKKKEDINK